MPIVKRLVSAGLIPLAGVVALGCGSSVATTKPKTTSPPTTAATTTVSYTHLDVYKRQDHLSPCCRGQGDDPIAGRKGGTPRGHQLGPGESSFGCHALSGQAVEFGHVGPPPGKHGGVLAGKGVCSPLVDQRV